MKKIFVLKPIAMLFFALLTGCTTYSVTMVHSEGVATDVVDETQTQAPSTSVEATASIPASVVP